MSHAKRPLEDKAPNVQPPLKRVSKGSNKPSETSIVKTQFAQRSFDGQYAYVCMRRPPWAFEEEEDEEDEDEESDSVAMKPASEHPEWKWVMMWESSTLLDTWIRDVKKRDPDCFNMYVYNDFHGSGVIEVVENVLKHFDKELNQKPYNFHQLWAIVAAFSHILHRGFIHPMSMVGDGERVERLCRLILCMALTALHGVDSLDGLRSDSQFRDLGHIMALFLRWGDIHDTSTLKDGTDVAETLIAYAAKAGIDLAEQGVCDVTETLEEYGDVEPLDGSFKADRWKWKSTFKSYRKQYTDEGEDDIGGEFFNLMKWSRKHRADYAFDKKDPLRKLSDAQIASGKLALI